MSFFNLQKQCGTQGKIQKLISGNLETFEETEISMALKKFNQEFSGKMD